MKKNEYKVLNWKEGGLILQEKHVYQDSPMLKNKAKVGTWSEWKDYKYPVAHGLMHTLFALLAEDNEEFGRLSTHDMNQFKEEVFEIHENYLERYEEITQNAVQQLIENGVISNED